MTNIQTNIGDLEKKLEDLQSITNANIARLQNYLEITSSANFKNLSYIDQRNSLDALSNNGSYLRDHIRESISKIDKIAFDIFLSTRFSCGDRSKLSMLIDIEHARVNKTPAKDIPFSVFKAMIAEEGIPVDDRNKLIRERGDKRFKELL
tara:strand:+ start:776 stop:1225 length:450 start_codon:yes stop_codon:yes gene_type:complete